MPTPDSQGYAPPPGTDAERVWWERVGRAAERLGAVGSKAMSDWVHEVLPVWSAGDGELVLVDGHWTPAPPERCTQEYKHAETCRLNDELGVRLGVGPMP